MRFRAFRRFPLLRLGGFFVLLFGTTSAAQAALIHDIFECPALPGPCNTFLGTISFPSASGTQMDGTGFVLSYQLGSTPFDENDIQQVDWNIDVGGTWLIDDLFLLLDDNPDCLSGAIGPCSQAAQRFTLVSPGLASTSPSAGGCSIGPSGLECASSIVIGPDNQFVPVPEPGAASLLSVALAGLGLAVQRRASRNTLVTPSRAGST